MRVVLAVMLLAVVGLGGCASPPRCPAEVPNCDTSVTPPPMSYGEIRYYTENPQARPPSMTEAVLEALIVQDMMWRNCWDCYGPVYRTRYVSYASYTPAQRQTVIQNNTTVIQKNTTIIQQAKTSAPAQAQAVQPPAQKVDVKPANPAVSGQNGGTGNGSAASSKGGGGSTQAQPQAQPASQSQPASNAASAPKSAPASSQSSAGGKR